MRPYHFHIHELFARLKSRPGGLSTAEAYDRLAVHGPNEIEAVARVSAIVILLRQFKSFIVYVLLFAVVFSMLLGEYVDTAVILLILVANTIIGFFQEYGAERSLEALTRLNIVQARVYRDGRLRVVNSRELVPGDVIDLSPGDQVPADARIVRQTGLLVDESNLTGESVPVNKHEQPLATPDEHPVGDRHNMIHSSTLIARGKSQALVTETGMNTEIGRIAALVARARHSQPPTPLQQRLDAFGRRLGFAIIAICGIVFAAMLARSAGDLNMPVIAGFALVAVSLAVAAVPTALPTIVTVALSIGVKRLLRKNALVRRLASVETLGSCDVICTDKTGTLTSNRMTVSGVFSLDGVAEIFTGTDSTATAKTAAPIESHRLVYRIGRLCNDATPGPVNAETGQIAWNGNPTEVALMVSAARAGVAADGAERLGELPFDNERKMMSVIVQDPDGPTPARTHLYTKGAADRLLQCCTHARIGGKTVPLTPTLRERIETWQAEQAGQALRVLAFAYRDLPEPANAVAPERDLEAGLVFAGLQSMFDPPRPDAAESIRRCRAAGIRVIMITGDYKETARAVGRLIGLDSTEPEAVLTGSELERMSQAELERALAPVDGVQIFARVSPEHKLRIVTALQSLGHTVAMTGDGVNDSPALKQADIGVAIGSGTAVAREAGDFVLVNDSFTGIVDAIHEGRGIFDNIQKSVMLLLSGNLGEVLIIFLAVICGMNLPLTAIMLLWINLITDGAPALAFSVDPYGAGIMDRGAPPKKNGILPRPLLILLGYLGAVGTFLGLGLFAYYDGHQAPVGSAQLELARTMVFNFVVLYEMLLVFMIRNEYEVPVFTNVWLWLAILLSATVQALLLYTPLGLYFGTAAPTGLDLVRLGATGVLFVCAYLAYRVARWRFRPRFSDAA